METPAEKWARLAVALEDLAAQEAGAIAARDALVLEQIERRAAPVVSHLCQHAAEIADAGIRRRIAAAAERRARSLTELSAIVDGTREHLERLRSNERRVAAVAPMYGRAGARPIRLSVVG